MSYLFSLTRLGPLISLVGGLLALLGLVLPLVNFSEVQGMVGQSTIDLLVLLALLAALAVLSFSAAALFCPLSPVLRGLGLLAASVGLLAQVDVLLTAALNSGMTLDNLPRLVSFLSSPGFLVGIFWLSLGFLLSGWGSALGAREGEQHQGVSLPLKHVSASASTDPPARETQTSRRWGRKAPSFRELPAQQSWWRIGRRQILAMLVGVLIFSVLNNLSIFWEGPGETNVQFVDLAVVLSVFLGIRYGPWVGLVTGGIGSVLTTLIGTFAHLPLWVLSNYGMLNSPPLDTTHPPLSWPLVLGSALVGFLAGLPLLGTPGREVSVRSVLVVTIRSALALVVGIALTAILAGVGQPAARPLVDIQGSLTDETLPTLLVGLLLLPLLFTLLPVGTGSKSEVEAFQEGVPREPGEDSNRS